ncbi:MAG: BppU family phage baseplate upper protein [bacterium]
MLTSKEINLYRGDDRTLEISVTDSQGQPVDLTGSSLKFSVKQSSSDVAYLVQKSSDFSSEISITDPIGGVFQIYLVPGDSNGLTPGAYQYDIELTSSAGKIYTVLRSELTVMDDITRP